MFRFLANSTLLYTSSKISLLWLTFCTKLRLRISHHAISSLLYVFTFIYYLLCCSSLILLSVDIKINPVLISSYGQSFSFCQWNLNRMSAHNYGKLSLLIAYNLVHNFDIICLSETYLTSETPPNNNACCG